MAAVRTNITEIDDLNREAWKLRNADPQRALELAATAENAARKAGYRNALVDSLNTQGYCCFRQSSYGKAIELLNEVLLQFRARDRPESKARSFNLLGQVYGQLGEYEKALDYYLQAFAIFEHSNDKSGQSAVLNSLGNIYYSTDKFAEAAAYYQKCLEIDTELDDNTGIAICFNNLGLAYQHMEQFGQAVDYLERSLDIHRELKDLHGMAFSLLNLGYAHQLSGSKVTALEYYRQSLLYRTELNDRYGQMSCLYKIGELHAGSGEPAVAVSFLEQALDLARVLGTKRDWYEICHIMAQVRKALGDYKRALECFEEFHTIKQQVFNNDSDQRLHRLMVYHQVERTRDEKEMYRLRNVQLELMMQNQTTQLSAMAQNLAQRNEFLKALQKQLGGIRVKSGESSDALLERLIASTRRRVQDDEQWVRFNEQLAGVHRNFIYSLCKQYTALTPMETRICSLLRLRLQSKEVAALLNVSVRNIEKYRLNLRRKFGLAPNHHLADFLHEMDRTAAREISTEDGEFIQRLVQRFPQLSYTEQRVCALLRSNLASKAVAELLCVSERTVGNHRYRIRKKLGLDAQQHLSTVLAGI